MSKQFLLAPSPRSQPGTPRLGPLNSRPGTPVSRPRTPLFGKFEFDDTVPGWQTKGSVISQALPIGRFSRWKFRIYLVFVLFTLGLVVAHAIRLNPQIASHVSQIFKPTTPAPYKLQVLIPATEPSLALCRTILTGAILNYPTPTLINWGKKFNDSDVMDSDKRPEKLQRFATMGGIRDIVGHMRDDRLEDLMLVVDSEESWFQLRPSVLVERYEWLLKDSDRYTKQRMGSAHYQEHIEQNAIFASRKSCAPNKEDSIGCFAQPESPLRGKMYGQNTNTEVGHTKTSSYKPRYLDHSLSVSTADNTRQIMVRALIKKMRDEGDSEAELLNSLHGEQEYQRMVMRERWLNILDKIKRFFGFRKVSILDPHPTHEKMEHYTARNHDFGLGLDYYGLLSHQTADSIHDARFVTYGSKDTAFDVDELDCKPNIKELPEDIQTTFLTSVRVSQPELNNMTWRDLPLYTNICTGNIPVVINHQGSAADRDRLWNQMWMKPLAKSLFRSQHRRAMVESPEDFGIDIGISAGGAWIHGGEKLTWEQMCYDYEDELFEGSA